MKKSLLFLSAAITIFILVLLANVVFMVRASALNSHSNKLVSTDTNVPTDTTAPIDTPTIQATDTAIVSPTVAGVITPLEAVFIASSALGNTKVYSVDTVTRYGMDVYQVNFSSGSIVFVSPQGHILTITALQSNVVQPTPNQQANSQSSSNKAPAQSSRPQENHDSGGDD
jgi:hypothetical protein